MDLVKELVEKVKLELTEKGKTLPEKEVSDFYEWMKVEYINYMFLTREDCLNTLRKLKNAYDKWATLIEVLEENINAYGSLQGFYRASL